VDGQPVTRLIDGVIVKSAVTHIDDRGTICEIHTPYAAPLEKPAEYVYQFTIRPGQIKGWHVHHLHDNRILISQGQVKVIPAFVYHAHHNIGTTDALFVSMPTRAYQHDDPDVFRFPIDSDEIPYRFDNRQGW
jgi:dTDP-4-dehydrorhamnose 3,5-epimerase